MLMVPVTSGVALWDRPCYITTISNAKNLRQYENWPSSNLEQVLASTLSTKSL